MESHSTRPEDQARPGQATIESYPVDPSKELTQRPQVVMIPLSDLVIPPWNPRKFMDEGEMKNLIPYLEKGGILPRILVWKGNGQAPWSVISGQRRLEAHRRLGRENVEAEILDISLEDAKLLAITSNQGAEVYWLDKYDGWEAYMADHPDWNKEEIASKLGVAPTWIRRSVNLMKVLNDNSRRMIQKALVENKPGPDQNLHENRPIPQSLRSTIENPDPNGSQETFWSLSEAVAYRLTDLLTPQQTVAESQALAERALPIILARQLSGLQTEELVAWMLSGMGADQFQGAPKGKRRPAVVEPPSATTGLNRQVAKDAKKSNPLEVKKEPTENQNIQPKIQPSQTGLWLLLPILKGWLKQMATRDLEMFNRGLIRKAVGWIFNWALYLSLLLGGAAYVAYHHTMAPINRQNANAPSGAKTYSGGTLPTNINSTTSAFPAPSSQTLSANNKTTALLAQASKPSAQGQSTNGSTASQNPASATSSEPSKVSDDSSVKIKPASKKDDGVAKFIGDAAGEAAKKALGF